MAGDSAMVMAASVPCGVSPRGRSDRFAPVPYGAEGYGPAMPLRGLLMDYAGVLTDGPEPADLVRRARAAGCPTALVTDTDVVPADCAALFDVLVLGAALGVRKPDPEVYRQTAVLLGLAAEDCVVVDDLAANLRGARAAGAVVVHHVAVEATLAEVEILLGLPDQSPRPGR